MNSTDLKKFIDRENIDAEILIMDGHTPTVEDAARELAVAPEQIIKSLVFRARDEPVLVINNGLARVDRRKLAQYLAVGRKKTKFASPEKALEITGFVVGSMPPFGHLTRLRTLVDSAVSGQAVIYGGGGDIDAMMRLTPAELLRVTGAEVVPLSEEKD
jgi:prolyl-tRNA editing enzyme YbaK/EbsC (Cys-tRNA(Pro) deacylase)